MEAPPRPGQVASRAEKTRKKRTTVEEKRPASSLFVTGHLFEFPCCCAAGGCRLCARLCFANLSTHVFWFVLPPGNASEASVQYPLRKSVPLQFGHGGICAV